MVGLIRFVPLSDVILKFKPDAISPVFRHLNPTIERYTAFHIDSESFLQKHLSYELSLKAAAQIAPTLHPVWNITSSDMNAINWTVQLVCCEFAM